MKFSARFDQEVPAERVFDVLANFSRMERMLMRRGVVVERREANGTTAHGWDLGFDWRGRRRELSMDLTQFDRPDTIGLRGRSTPFDVAAKMTVIAMSRVKSRLVVELEVRPRNMRARLALQTAKLGKASLDRKFARKFRSFLDDALVS